MRTDDSFTTIELLPVSFDHLILWTKLIIHMPFFAINGKLINIKVIFRV